MTGLGSSQNYGMYKLTQDYGNLPVSGTLMSQTLSCLNKKWIKDKDGNRNQYSWRWCDYLTECNIGICRKGTHSGNILAGIIMVLQKLSGSHEPFSLLSAQHWPISSYLHRNQLQENKEMFERNCFKILWLFFNIHVQVTIWQQL